MNRHTRNAILALASLPLFAGSTVVALSQGDTARTLSGTVTGSNHQPIAGAVVKLENQANSSIVSFITDEAGHYTFKRIATNANYQVWAAFNGARSKQKEVSSLATSTAPTVDLQIETK